jgi:hypothetical protein
MSYRPALATTLAWRGAFPPVFAAYIHLRPGTHTRAWGTMVSTYQPLYKHVRAVLWLT